MIKPEYIKLMNQELDGTNSPVQSRELEKYLSGQEEARIYYRELAQAVGVFEKVDMVNPPPGLRNRILAQVDQQVDQRAAGLGPGPAPRDGSGFLAACRDLFNLRLQPAYAFTFTAGLALGLALFAGSDWFTSDRGPVQVEHVSGTANHRVLEHGGDLLETLSYPGLSGHYRLQRQGNDLSLHLELASLKPAVVEFRFGPTTVLQHYHSDNPAPAGLKAGPTAAELSHTGDGRYDLVFRQGQDNPAPVTMSVFLEGGLIHSETLSEPGK